MKNQIDYKLLQALAAVVKEQSFERAAVAIFVTQSAISQRIKQLEQVVSQPVLVRSTPPVATEVGKKLIKHYYQVEQLERELNQEVFPETLESPLTVHIATNADSLATWLIPALADTLKHNLVELNFLISDEQYTIEKLRSGEAFGAITLEKRALKGCQSTYLGDFEYALVASPEFRQRYFAKGITSETLRLAPSAAFDQRDNMHISFIEQKYGLKRGDYPLHSVRSSEAFVALARNGAAHCLVAELQIREQLASGELVDLLPDFKLVKKLYWQRWTLLKGVHQKLSEAIIVEGKRRLSGIK